MKLYDFFDLAIVAMMTLIAGLTLYLWQPAHPVSHALLCIAVACANLGNIAGRRLTDLLHQRIRELEAR